MLLKRLALQVAELIFQVRGVIFEVMGLLRTRGIEEPRPYLGVCRLVVAPGLPFRLGAVRLEGLGSWWGGDPGVFVSRIPPRPLEDQRPRGAEALSWGLLFGGSRASL